MLYTFCIVLVLIASVLLILAVLVQSPKSGMAANFGAANQTMGVRQTSDFLEKFTWAMIAAVVFFTLLSVVALSVDKKEVEAADTEIIDNLLNEAKAEAEVEEVVLENEADPNATEVVEETAEVVEE